MPCMGPTMPGEEEIDTVTTEVLNFLKEKYAVFTMPEDFIGKSFLDVRNKTISQLKEAIKQILIQEACEIF